MHNAEFDQLIAKLPHEGSMRLIDSIVRIDKHSVVTQTVVDEMRRDLFGSESIIESYLGIELIAQSAALSLIYGADKDKNHKGMIVQVRSFRSFGEANAEVAVFTTCCEVELLLDGKVASVVGSVSCEKSRLCESVITLAVQGE